MKDKEYIRKIAVIAKADIENGNKDKLLESMDRLIEEQDYETCEGIKRALTNE